MKPNSKKLSFSALAILFAVQVVVCLFAGTLYSQFLPFDANTVLMAILVIAFVPVMFFRGRTFSALYDLTINDTTYAGEFYDIFLTKMLTGFETARKGLIKIKAGIKKKGTVGHLDITNFIQAAQDPPIHGGNVAVGARTLVPDDVMGYLEEDPSKFEDHWLAVVMNPALLDRALPVTFEAATVSRIMELNENWMDRILWRGIKDDAAITTALADGLGDGDSDLIFTNGIIFTCLSDLDDTHMINTLVPVGAEAVVLTAANIVAKFDQLKARIHAVAEGPGVYDHADFCFIVSKKTGTLYGDAQKALANKGVDFTEKGKLTYDGKPIHVVGGQHDDTIWAGVANSDETSQLWLGCNEADEHTKFRIGRLQANSEKIFVKMLAKFCFNIGRVDQVFLYTTQEL